MNTVSKFINSNTVLFCVKEHIQNRFNELREFSLHFLPKYKVIGNRLIQDYNLYRFH